MSVVCKALYASVLQSYFQQSQTRKKVLQTVQEINGSASCPVFVCSSTGHRKGNKFIDLNSEMDKPQNTFTQ